MDLAEHTERERIAAWLENYDKDSTRLANIAEAIRSGCHEHIRANTHKVKS